MLQRILITKQNWQIAIKQNEDAVQYFAAKSQPEITGIISRNVRDFKLSELEVKDSVDFL